MREEPGAALSGKELPRRPKETSDLKQQRKKTANPRGKERFVLTLREEKKVGFNTGGEGKVSENANDRPLLVLSWREKIRNASES